MTAIKCNAKDCKYLKENTCSLANINIDFNYDPEGYGAFCSNFIQSDKSRKRTYRLHKLKEGLYFAIRTSVFDDVDIQMIINELNEDNAIVIADNLLYYGSSKVSNRFWVYRIDKECIKFDGEVWSKGKLVEYLKLNNISTKTVLKKTCDYVRETKNYGCLVSTAHKMIMKGIDL